MNKQDEIISEYAYRANRMLDHPVLNGGALIIGVCSLGYCAFKAISEVVDDIKFKKNKREFRGLE